MQMDNDLAAQFAAEQERREGRRPEEVAEETPFTGIREIVLDGAGKPRSIPRRPPPPAPTQQGEVADLVQNPLFAFGVLMSAITAGLLLAIAAADSAA